MRLTLCVLALVAACSNKYDGAAGDDGAGDDGSSGPPSGACDNPATCEYEASCPPLLDATALGLTACGDGAHCLDVALIPDPMQAALLAKCEDTTKACVPDVFLRTGGKFTPASCKSLNDAEGRCLSLVIPQVADQADRLPQDTCAANERCTPCFDPVDGSSTGACTQSCDTGPKEPPKMLAACCGGRAHCVPATSVPTDQQDNLSEQECATEQAGSLCVPDEVINGGPFPTCDGTLFGTAYTGVCLSTCLDFGFQGLFLGQGTCTSADFKCAPCTLNGAPTGAPGCPP